MHARCLKLHHCTCDKLVRDKIEAERDGAYRVARRIHAVLMNHDGKTSGEIASLGFRTMPPITKTIDRPDLECVEDQHPFFLFSIPHLYHKLKNITQEV